MPQRAAAAGRGKGGRAGLASPATKVAVAKSTGSVAAPRKRQDKCGGAGRPDTIVLARWPETSAAGMWRRIFRPYHARFTEDLVVDFSGGALQPVCAPLVISQTVKIEGWDSEEPMTTGGTVWDSAVLLSSYLQQSPRLVQHQQVLELGAGTGLVGLAARRLGATHVMLTDLPPMLPLLQRNAYRNFPGTEAESGVSVRALNFQEVLEVEWLLAGHVFELVLISDVLYHEHAFEPLLTALSGLARRKRTLGRLRGIWTQELHQPALHQKFVEALRDTGWNVSSLRVIDDGTGPDISMCEIVGPELPVFEPAGSALASGTGRELTRAVLTLVYSRLLTDERRRNAGVLEAAV